MTKLGAWTPGSLQGQPTWPGLKSPLWVVKVFKKKQNKKNPSSEPTYNSPAIYLKGESRAALTALG